MQPRRNSNEVDRLERPIETRNITLDIIDILQKTCDDDREINVDLFDAQPQSKIGKNKYFTAKAKFKCKHGCTVIKTQKNKKVETFSAWGSVYGTVAF